MVETNVGWTTTRLRPSNKCLTTVVSTAEYTASKPVTEVEPGLCNTKARQKAKAKKCYDDKVLTCWYTDKQFWIGIKQYKPTDCEKARWNEFHADYWRVPEIDDEHPCKNFAEYKEAKAYLDTCKNTYGITPQFKVCKDPDTIKWIFKMPWVTFCLEDYDIAKEWNTWLFDTYKLDYLSEFVKTTRICKYCGKEFVPFHPSNQFTCGSEACQRLAHHDFCKASDKSNERRSWKRRTKGTVSCKICNRPLVRQEELGINASCDCVHEACAILEIVNTLLMGDTVCQRQRDWMKNHGYSLAELRKDILTDEYRALLVY